MWTLFSISLGIGKPEFSMRGIVTGFEDVAKFQGVVNGAVFCEGFSPDEVRQSIMDVVELNKPVDKDGLQ
jgi:hypothetical protein